LVAGGLGRDPAWLHAPANNFRGSMGHQFRSELHKGDSIPLFVPQIYRTIDLQNYNGETNTIHVRVGSRRFGSIGALGRLHLVAGHHGAGPALAQSVSVVRRCFTTGFG
jgi:hypothetical protein